MCDNARVDGVPFARLSLPALHWIDADGWFRHMTHSEWGISREELDRCLIVDWTWRLADDGVAGPIPGRRPQPQPTAPGRVVALTRDEWFTANGFLHIKGKTDLRHVADYPAQRVYVACDRNCW